MGSLLAEPECVHYLSIVGLLLRMVKLLACAINCGLFFANGRTALRARSIVASLMRMAKLLCVRDRL